MFDDNRKTFVATLYNVLLAPELCDRLFSIITLMNAVHTCLFHKGFCAVYFGAKEDNAVTLPHSAVRKHAFMGKSMESLKKNPKRKKIALELMHQRLGHRSTRLLIAGDTCIFHKEFCTVYFGLKEDNAVMLVDFLTILWKNVSKISEKKKRKLVLLVLLLK